MEEMLYIISFIVAVFVVAVKVNQTWIVRFPFWAVTLPIMLVRLAGLTWLVWLSVKVIKFWHGV